MNIYYPLLWVSLYFVLMVIYNGIKGKTEKQNKAVILSHLWMATSLIIGTIKCGIQ